MTNETKQTAVDQLFVAMLQIQQAGILLTFDEYFELLGKYKEIEKQQISQAYEEGTHDEYVYQVFHAENLRKDGEQYYNENYTK